MAAQHLRGQGSIVVTVFIQPLAVWDSNTLKAIMHSILRQLSSSRGLRVHDHGQSYQELSIDAIREQMHQAFTRRATGPKTRHPVFLLIDGSDSSEMWFHERLELELSALQKLGIKILVTSRHNCALTTHFFYTHRCDFCESQELRDQRLEVYWQCEKCEYEACHECHPRISGLCTYKAAVQKW